MYACPGGVAGQNFKTGTLQLDCPTSDGGPGVIGRFGNATVGSLVGPKTINLSLGLAKDFRITERVVFKFESSLTNLPNHINFDDPPNDLSDPGFGVVTKSRLGDAGGNRVGQFALRIEF